jgi:hypothetical protein
MHPQTANPPASLPSVVWQRGHNRGDNRVVTTVVTTRVTKVMDITVALRKSARSIIL